MSAKEANEQVYRQAVLDKLDRIIQLLTPDPDSATTTIWSPVTMQCGMCKQWYPIGSDHICMGWRHGTSTADWSNEAGAEHGTRRDER